MLQVDRLGQVGRNRRHAPAGDVVHPLDHFRNRAPRAGDFAGLLEQRDLHFLLRAGRRVLDLERLRFDGKVRNAQPLVEERIALDVDAELEVVLHLIADLDDAIGEPVAEAVLVEHRHGDVHVRLELDEALLRVGHRAVADALELDAVLLFERLRQRDEVVRVHLHRVGMARIADDLIARAGDLAVRRRRPVALDRLADDDDRPAVGRIEVLHRLERADDLVVVVAVGHRQHVPAVRVPLLDEVVAGVLAVDDAADERVVDAGVVLGEHHAQPLADFERERLRLELLRVAGAERELAFERDHLRLIDGRADHVPEGRLAGGRREADARRSAVDVVALIDRFDVARERVDAAPAFLGLGEERVVGEPVILQQRLQRAGAAAEAERVDREEAVLGRDVILLVAGRLELPVQRLAHDHPERIAGRRAVACGEHELVAVGMLRAPVVVAKPAELGAGQVHGDVVRRVGERAAEVAGLGVVAEQRQRHARHEPDVFEPLFVFGIQQSRA